MKIDLRSDTLTKPTPAMLSAMMQAEVGDDVFEDDPTVNALEQKAASLFGMQSALFCASGTLTNQLAIRVHCTPGSEVICDQYAHVYVSEGGGIALNALSSVKTVAGNRGRITASQIESVINNANDVHQPITRLVYLETTMNKGGGSIYDFSEIQAIRALCNQHQLALHLDGARLFNALVETGESPAQHGQVFDSISICLSKGLGCPVGSLLLGSQSFIKQARRFRKVMGGGWRQAGFLAAAGIYALDHHIDRLRIDHARAKQIGDMLLSQSYVEEIFPISTNIVIIRLPDTLLATDFVHTMAQRDLFCVPFGKHLVRFVTHLDFDDKQLEAMPSKLSL